MVRKMDSIGGKVMCSIKGAVTRGIMLCLILCAATQAWAEDAATQKTNPVTGDTETYTYYFTGTIDGNWSDARNWDSRVIPGLTGNYVPFVFDGKYCTSKAITVPAESKVEGWDLRMGLYNGVDVTINQLFKYQDGCWVTVDTTSKLKIEALGSGNFANDIDFYVAAPSGIVYNVDFGKGGNYRYHFVGQGSVAYKALTGGTHTIKQADVILSGGEKAVRSKTLVSFTSSTKAFIADARIKRRNSSGADLDNDILVAGVNSTGATTLTTNDKVGKCEFVQTSTAIVLYWVDGDPSELISTVYRPSISINFTHSGVGLSTAADVGIGEYAVPGTSWVNMAGANGTCSSIYCVDSTGASSQVASASITISDASGSYRYDDSSGGTTLYNGYIDDNDNNTTPKIYITGIPYYSYKLVLYFSNDTDGRPFGHLTVNGTNYKWDSTSRKIVTCTGVEADSWGSSKHGAWTEGGNYLVFPAMMNNSEGTLTVVGHRWSGTKRAGIAAIQIVEAVDLVSVISPFSGVELSAPTSALAYSGVSENETVSFGNKTAYQQTVNEKNAVVVNVTGGTYDDIFGLLKVNETIADANRDVYLLVGGETVAKRVSGVQNAHWQGNVTTSTTGDAIVQIGGRAQVDYAFGAGIKGGNDAVVNGNTGVTICEEAVIKGSVFGGWSSAHTKNPQVNGNTYVRVKNLQSNDTASGYDSIRAGFVVGGSTYQSNNGASRTTITGNSSAIVDIPSSASGTFTKAIIGASLYPKDGTGYSDSYDETQAVNGNSSVLISAPRQVTFSGTIVGGGYTGKYANGVSKIRTTVGGNSSVTLNGGTYTNRVVAGGYGAVANAIATVSGTATLTINGGVFTNATLDGGNASQSKILTVGEGVDLSGVAAIEGFDTINVSGTESTLNGLSIRSGATVKIVSSTITSLTLTGFSNSGTLDLSECTALTAVVVAPVDGSIRSDFATLARPSGLREESSYAILLAETREEFGKGSVIVTGVPTGAKVIVSRPDESGSAEIVPDENGTATLTEDVKISGAATLYDITFANNTSDTKDNGTFTYKGDADGTLKYDTEPTFNDAGTGVYLKHHPYIDGAHSIFNSLTDFTAVVVGQMSPSTKTEFIHFGSTKSAGNTGLLIATTENANEVVIASTTYNTVNDAAGVTVKIPNAATARHAFVIIKSGTTFSVYADGVKRGTFNVAEGFKLGVSGHSGIQVGSDFGGTIKDAAEYTNVAVKDSETGVVDVIRVFDYAISEAQALAVTDAYPYVPQGGLYTRTVSADANLSADRTWAKEGSESTFALPKGATVSEQFFDPSATITVADESTLVVNADLQLETLTIGGSEALTIKSDGVRAIRPTTAIINTTVTNVYGAVDFNGTTVQFSSEGALCIDCSGIDISTYYVSSTIQLTGTIDNVPSQFSVILPTATISQTASLHYNDNGFYELIITPDHEDGSDVYYTGGYWSSDSNNTISVTNSSGNATIVFPGDTVVIPVCYAGTEAWFAANLPANVSRIRVARDFSFHAGVTDAILGGATITVDADKKLTVNRKASGQSAVTLGSVTFSGDGTVQLGSTDDVSKELALSGGVVCNATISIPTGVTVTFGRDAALTVGLYDTIDEKQLTTNEAHSRVRPTTDGETKTYRVEEIPGTIFSVW